MLHPALRRRLLGRYAPFASLLVALVAGPLFGQSTQWDGSAGTSGTGSWLNADNWDAGLPTATMDAILPSGATNTTVVLGSGATAKTLFVQDNGYELRSGDLTLADQLWINDSNVSLTLGGGSTVTAANATVGASPTTTSAGLVLSSSSGAVAFGVIGTLDIGYEGSGNSLQTTGGVGSSISADTIRLSVASGAGASDYNWLGTYTVGDTVTATNLYVGVDGDFGGAETYGGTWTIGNTFVGINATSESNYVTIAGGSGYTNSGAFVIGVAGSHNTVWVGDDTTTPVTSGTLTITGSSDLVIGGTAVTADSNALVVAAGSSLSVVKNIVVGQNGSSNEFDIRGGSTVASGGARVGVSAGADSNVVHVSDAGSLWTMNGTVRLGGNGSSNAFTIDSGAVVELTGVGKNFFVGYGASSIDNVLTVTGSGSELRMHATGADLLISAQGGTGNLARVMDGGLLDVERTLVGAGGTLAGDATVGGDVFVGGGGTVAPGNGIDGTIGTLSFLGDLDLSDNGYGVGLFDADIAGAASDRLSVGGLLKLTGAALHFDVSGGPLSAFYVLADYGTLDGVFGTVVGLPTGWTLDYNFQGLNELALVSPVPEIDAASLGSGLSFLLGALAVLERRRRGQKTA